MSAAADALMGIFGFKRVEIEMKTVEQTRRELFEAWYRGEFPASELRIQNLIGTYTKHHADLCWQGFNAALDAVVIELPDSYIDAPRYACYKGGWNDMRGETVDAIESTNLGLKII